MIPYKYYKKKDEITEPDKYGYRRRFIAEKEKWDALKKQYKEDKNTGESLEFTYSRYQYRLDPENSEERKTLIKNMLDYLNQRDPKLMEGRIKEWDEECKKDILAELKEIKNSIDFSAKGVIEEIIKNLDAIEEEVLDLIKKGQEYVQQGFHGASQQRYEIAGKNTRHHKALSLLNNNVNNEKYDILSHAYYTWHCAVNFSDLIDRFIPGFSSNEYTSYGKDKDTPVHTFAQYGYEKGIHLICNKYPGIKDKFNLRHHKPIHAAVISGHKEIIKLFINEYNMDPNDLSGSDSLIALACLHRRKDIVKYLVEEKNVNVNLVADGRLTPLNWACSSGDKDIILYLLEQGAAIGACSYMGIGNELHVLIASKNIVDAMHSRNIGYVYNEAGVLGAFEHLCTKYSHLMEGVDDIGRTPLHFAFAMGFTSIAQIMLDKGCNGNCKTYVKSKWNDQRQHWYIVSSDDGHERGYTVLHIVAEKGEKGWLKFVKQLLKNGAVYNIKNDEGKTPFDLAEDDELKELLNLVGELFENVKEGNDQQVVHYLNKEKAIVNARDTDGGGTPLYYAIYDGHMNTARLLLENGADPTLVTNKGSTPLHMASSKGNNEIVRLLLKSIKLNKLSSFINTQTTIGKTSALHIASNTEVTRSLLQYGAVYNIKNKEGKTPLDLVKNDDIRKLLSFTNELFEDAKNGNHDIIGKLDNLEEDNFTAVTNARNDQGHTLLQVAIANKHRDIATELSKMLKKLAPSSSMESVNVADPSRHFNKFH